MSPEPIIIDDAKLSILSAPNLSRIEAYEAVEAEPEKGFVITRGIIPAGIPRNSPTGEVSADIPSAAPLALNIVRETRRSVRVGKMFTVVVNPFFAPLLEILYEILSIFKCQKSSDN